MAVESAPEQGALVKVRALKLDADGQTAAAEAPRHRYPRQTGQVGRQSENVREVHGQRVINFFSLLPGRSRRNRRNQQVTRLPGLSEIVEDQGPDLGRFLVVSIIVPR